MSGLFRVLLMLLVLLDLAFVQITGAADLLWLGPLVGFTLASPLLLPLRRFLLYRLLWNGAVLAVFAVLVQHASSAGIQFMLEDGLLLAALCQVHLLNNIGRDQKPDLIFFNSFLIPVVTCFLSVDLEYSLLFLIYVPVLVLALMTHVFEREGRAATAPALRRLFLEGGARAAAVLAVTLLLFFFLPRDFGRKGLLGDRLDWRPGQMVKTGFSDEVSLGETGPNAGGGSRVVMTVTLSNGLAEDVPAAWRGATLDRFDGRSWRASHAAGSGERDPWRFAGRGVWIRRDPPPGPEVVVELRDTTAGRLFVPLESRRISLGPGAGAAAVDAAPDQTFVHPVGRGGGGSVRYEVETSAPPTLGGPVGGGTRRVSSVFWRLDPGTAPEVAVLAAERLRRAVGEDAPQHAVVEGMRAWLAATFDWLPPGSAEGAESLAEFLSGEKGGHCEYFATALAVMLRTEGIPCRLVTGYRSGEWGSERRILTFRDRHAHAWVEVYDPEGGWYTVDPSPPAPDEAAAAGAGLLARIRAAFTGAWQAVTSLTEEGRRAALAWLGALPGRLLGVAVEHPVPVGAVALLLSFLLVVRRRHGRPPAVVREYLRAVRRAKLEIGPGETPRELLRRARRLALPPKRLVPLEAATARHEAERYTPA